ncbi:proline-rich transmembrane protein 1-like isoform X2 [Pristis pectinata]|uniref:proline-rich transmembrane protein 1-like isoform X2 n=1 Tax=Pristis pectinata TaxID=685728 RepID=UPI00223DF281|nr:proline-rich transmembrane protein 1-like isoform X2 [Pristis pectinata]
MSTEKTDPSEAPPQTSSPPPYSQVIEVQHNAPSPGYSVQVRMPPLPVGERGYMQETQFHGRAPGYTTLLPHGPMGPSPYIAPPPPGYAVQLQPYTTLVPIYPIGNTRAAMSRGDHLSAQIASRQARNYSFISLAVGISAMVLCAILVIVVAIEAKHRDAEWGP